MCFIACVVLVATLATSAHAGSGSEYTTVERFGAGVVRGYGDITDYDVASLPIGWYMDWGYRESPPRPGGIEYAQLVPTRLGSFPPNWDSLGAAVRANPGSMWFIGNEPDALSQYPRCPTAGELCRGLPCDLHFHQRARPDGTGRPWWV